jgi:hypothetical protein
VDSKEPSKHSSAEPDSLQHFLADTEAELQRRLREACDAESRGVSTESSEEIRHLEDTLLAAAAAAETTIAVRKRVRGQGRKPGAGSGATNSTAEKQKPAQLSSSVEAEPTRQSTSVREFTDTAGQRWRAWPVVPELSRAREGRQGFLGSFQEGWICFEGLNTTNRRRLPYRPPDWADMSEAKLRSLLGDALDAPVRKAPKDGGK